MSRRKTGSALFWGAAVIVLGYGIMKAATPTDEQFYKALSPELRSRVESEMNDPSFAAPSGLYAEHVATTAMQRKVDEHRNQQARQDQYDRIRASADAGEPVFQDSLTGKTVRPSERRTS